MPPRMPFGRKMITDDQQQAEPEIPVLRVHVGKLVARDHEDHRADQPAIEPAGAAEDQHDQHFGRALEAQAHRARRTRVVCAERPPAMPAKAAEIM